MDFWSHGLINPARAIENVIEDPSSEFLPHLETTFQINLDDLCSRRNWKPRSPQRQRQSNPGRLR
jgi:hypothetical protein